MDQEIDYRNYAINMRKAFSGKIIANLPQGDINHKYFNTKKGQYWSEKDEDTFQKGILKCGVDQPADISKEFFGGEVYS